MTSSNGQRAGALVLSPRRAAGADGPSTLDPTARTGPPALTARCLAIVAVAGGGSALAAGLLAADSEVLAAPGVNGVYRGLAVASWIGVGLLTWRLRPDSRFGPLLVATGFAYALTTLMAADDRALFTLGRIAWALFAVVLVYVVLTFPHGELERGPPTAVFGVFVAGVVVLWTALLLGSPDLPSGGVLTRCRGDCPTNPFRLTELGATPASVLTHAATFLIAVTLLAVAALLLRRALTLDGLARATLLVPLACLLVFAVSVALSTAVRSTAGDDTAGLALGWVGAAAGLAIPYTLVLGQARGRLFRRAAQLEAENAALTVELRAYATELRASRARIFSAGEQERRRIERDLHDSAQNRLVALRVKLALAAERAADDGVGGLERTLAELGDEAQDALDAVRTIANGIYPPLLATRGLGDALEAEADGAALAVRIVGGDTVPRSTPEAEAALYFCCLEAIQNACKHAGVGAHVTVRLAREDDGVAFSIEDDGAGFDAGASRAADDGGAGLTNMRDRVDAVGGAVGVASAPGRGTVVSGSAPWPARPPHVAY